MIAPTAWTPRTCYQCNKNPEVHISLQYIEGTAGLCAECSRPPFDFNDYQRQAMRTAKGGANHVYIRALGLGGECGEVLELIKKHLGHGKPLDRVALTAELGDVLWYLATLARAFDLDLVTVAVANIEKLRIRYPEGPPEESFETLSAPPPRPGPPDLSSSKWEAKEPSPLHASVLRLDEVEELESLLHGAEE